MDRVYVHTLRIAGHGAFPELFSGTLTNGAQRWAPGGRPAEREPPMFPLQRRKPWNAPLSVIAASRGRTDVDMSRMVSTTDRLLIRLLQQNARISFAELSRVTSIPESTVRRRVERLQDRGIIRFAMIAEADQLGYEISAMIGLRIDLARLKEIGDEITEMSEVVFASFLTGSFDILAQVVVESQPALVEFLTRLARIEGIRTTETFLMPHVLKPMTAWVIPQPEDGFDRDGIEPGD